MNKSKLDRDMKREITKKYVKDDLTIFAQTDGFGNNGAYASIVFEG